MFKNDLTEFRAFVKFLGCVTETFITGSFFEEYAFFSYECKPLRTEFCTSAEVLDFRDKAFIKYFSNNVYLDSIEKKFGLENKNNILEMLKIKLKRKILEKVE